ncbi:DUF302 domain-containing protein [endosymbiont of unidentified scaly snail isolate Monju]|uniref:DUF302 domain-containing protein n=1 Tax=endosymbiont of unidentified scaly snail isolate Monju TaxID=1248727 RepID=UPI0003892844|nr:DUF302 domain-containing protein [endosymbiont of unidentified scaly snail isolate Monju]BAN68625.1 conserved hypothetical protein [endosymbiont of unidentified scaly snail isolate Monju]
MYEFNLTLDLPFEQALEKVREALMSEHLGIVSEVDVQAIFKAKMDKDIPPYRILGACNPKLADRVLSVEPNAGTLLPCNLVLRDAGDDKTVVSFMDPVAVLGLSESAEVRAVAEEARDKLQRVVAGLGG